MEVLHPELFANQPSKAVRIAMLRTREGKTVVLRGVEPALLQVAPSQGIRGSKQGTRGTYTGY